MPTKKAAGRAPRTAEDQIHAKADEIIRELKALIAQIEAKPRKRTPKAVSK